MSTDTATVETLTAEVRVLMVGNRQITQSVAKQLDVVRGDQMTPFGRIHPFGPPTAEDRVVHLIGRDEQGSLVRGVATPPTGSISDVKRWGHSPEQFQRYRDLPLIVLAGLR